MVSAHKPTSSRISSRDACGINSAGKPSSLNAVSTPAARISWRMREPTPPARTPSSRVTTMRWSRAKSTTECGTGITHRGSITVEWMPCSARRSDTSSATRAIAPTATNSTSRCPVSGCGRPVRVSTSTPSERRSRAAISSPTDPFGYLTTVGASSIATASRSASRSVAASRGAAKFNPGINCRSDKSHMPW